MRLIDADVLRTSIEKDRDASDMPKMWYEGIAYAINHIIHAPTANVHEVKHGKWIWQGSISEGCWVCSECEHKFYQGYGNENYCPHCGAKMDGKETEDGTDINTDSH